MFKMKMAIIAFHFLTFIILVNATNAYICPQLCACGGNRMSCDILFPTFIPTNATDVELLNIESDIYMYGVFCKTSWNNVRNLSLWCLATCTHSSTMDNNTFRG